MVVVGGGGEDGKSGGGVAGARRVPEDAAVGDPAGARGLPVLGREDRRPCLPVAADQDPRAGKAHPRDDGLLRELHHPGDRALPERRALQLRHHEEQPAREAGVVCERALHRAADMRAADGAA